VYEREGAVFVRSGVSVRAVRKNRCRAVFVRSGVSVRAVRKNRCRAVFATARCCTDTSVDKRQYVDIQSFTQNDLYRIITSLILAYLT
jgi:hypothetical protein